YKYHFIRKKVGNTKKSWKTFYIILNVSCLACKIKDSKKISCKLLPGQRPGKGLKEIQQPVGLPDSNQNIILSNMMGIFSKKKSNIHLGRKFYCGVLVGYGYI
ncbi:MAG: hypothetical protein K940chlam7_01281, partial [Chlamydiae bacterium]|nr:hypothetical protein [Chlamydiota bacterium]